MNMNSTQRVASRYLQAADIKRTLSNVLAPLQPYVKNWRGFLDSMAGFVTLESIEEEVSVVPFSVKTLFTEEVFSNVTVPSKSYWEPDSDVEVPLGTAPSLLSMTLQLGLPIDKLISWTVSEASKGAAPGKAREIKSVVLDILNDKNSMALIAKMMADNLSYMAKVGWTENDVEMHLLNRRSEGFDVLREDFEGENLEWRLDKIKPVKHWFKIQGRDINLYVKVEVSLEDFRGDPPDPY